MTSYAHLIEVIAQAEHLWLEVLKPHLLLWRRRYYSPLNTKAVAISIHSWIRDCRARHVHGSAVGSTWGFTIITPLFQFFKLCWYSVVAVWRPMFEWLEDATISVLLEIMDGSWNSRYTITIRVAFPHIPRYAGIAIFMHPLQNIRQRTDEVPWWPRSLCSTPRPRIIYSHFHLYFASIEHESSHDIGAFGGT